MSVGVEREMGKGGKGGRGVGRLCNCVCLIFIPLTGDQGLLC